MATTRNTKNANGKAARGAREIAEAQSDRYEALAENFATFNRRSVGFAEDGLEILKLQESNARAAREWWANGVRLLELQRRSAGFAQNWLSGGFSLWREQAENNRRTAEVLAQSVQKQQEGFRKLTEGWAEAYQNYQNFFSPFVYFQKNFQEGLRVAEQATRQGLEATQQASREGLRVAEEAAEQTDQAIRQAGQVAREAELRAAAQGALKTGDYDELNVDEVAERLDALTVGELQKVHEYEKRGHDRETLVERIEQKIRAKS